MYISALSNDWVRLVGKGDSTHRTYGLWISNGGNVLWQMYGGNGSSLSSNTTLSTGTWYHIAATRSGNTLAMYINGVAQGTTSYSGEPYSSTEPLTIGSAATFHGYLNGKSVSYTHLTLPTKA